MTLQNQAFFDDVSGTITHVLSDGRDAAVIDSVLGFDPIAARTSTELADRVIQYVQSKHLALQWILETHVHTDHLSAASYLKERLGGQIAMGKQICEVQRIFNDFYNLGPQARVGGWPFDHLFRDGEVFQVGTLAVTAWHVPGHTPADMAYQVEDLLFVGDTLFLPDVGTARTDFPGGSASALYQSIRRILALPGHTRLMHCHDYPPAGRAVQWESTVAEQCAANIHARDGISEAQFIATRQARDAILPPPKLMLSALQVNIHAGQLPPAENNGVSYLKIPLNVLRSPPADESKDRATK